MTKTKSNGDATVSDLIAAVVSKPSRSNAELGRRLAKVIEERVAAGKFSATDMESVQQLDRLLGTNEHETLLTTAHDGLAAIAARRGGDFEPDEDDGRADPDLVAEVLILVVETLTKAKVLACKPDLALTSGMVALGVSSGEVEEASSRLRRRGWLPPAWKRISEEARDRYMIGVRRGARAAGDKKTRQPRRGQEKMYCPACGNDLLVVHFEKRADRPGQRRTICRGCRRDASRDRYLSVSKQKAMNVARLTFVLSGDEAKMELRCIDCGEELVAGDEVEGRTQLSHTSCPSSR